MVLDNYVIKIITLDNRIFLRKYNIYSIHDKDLINGPYNYTNFVKTAGTELVY